MATAPERDVPAEINAFMVDLYRAHDVPAQVSGDWVVFADQPYRTRGEVNRERVLPDGDHAMVVQITFELAPDVEVVECFSGWGGTWEEAYHDGMANFGRNTFHVFVAAFFDVICGEQVNEEVWRIAGRDRRVSASNVGIRGQCPRTPDGRPDMDWFADFQRRVEAQQIGPGVHWVRMFYMRRQEEVIASEILFDNEPWGEMEPEMDQIAWPRSDDIYGFRLFFVIHDHRADHKPRLLAGCS